MDHPQHSIAVSHSLNDDSYRHQIKDLVQVFVLVLHLLVYAVEMLGSSVYVVLYPYLVQRRPYLLHYSLDGFFAFFLALVDLFRQIVVSLGFQELEGDILQLHLHGVYTQSGCQRSVYVQSFPALFYYLVVGHIVDGPQVMEPVRKLYYQHPYILGHGQEHLSQIFGLTFLLALELEGAQLGHAVYQQPHFFAEFRYQLFFGIFRILHHVVKESCYYGLLVHSQISQYLRHRHRVYQIRFSRLSQLSAVHLLSHIISSPYQLDIIVWIEL